MKNRASEPLKKMVLIPLEQFEQLKSTVNKTPEAGLGEVLKSRKKVKEKLQQYQTVLRENVIAHHHKPENEVKVKDPAVNQPPPQFAAVETQTLAVDVFKPYQLELQKVVDSLPTSFRSSGSALLKHVNRADPAKLTWTDQGEVIINEKRILGSNIGEYLEILSRSKGVPVWPEGLDKFMEVLQEIDTPLSCIVNRDVYVAGTSGGKMPNVEIKDEKKVQLGSGKWIPHLIRKRKRCLP